MAVDLDQSVDHPLVLFTVGVGIVLQHQPGLGHPDWIGEGECEDAWLIRLGQQHVIAVSNIQQF